jgi:hypothetical protein
MYSTSQQGITAKFGVYVLLAPSVCTSCFSELVAPFSGIRGNFYFLRKEHTGRLVGLFIDSFTEFKNNF